VHQTITPTLPLSLSLAAPWHRPVSSAFPAPVVEEHARTRARTLRSLATSPTHAPQLLFEHRPRPHSLPRPISHSLTLSCSAHAARPRRRSAPAMPVVQSAGSHARPPRAPPRGKTPVPMLGFPNCASLLANFDFVGGWSWRSAAPARWPAKLARSSAPATTLGVPLDLLKLVQALARLRPPPHGGIPHRSYPTRPESSFNHSPLSDQGLVATTLPVSLPCLPLRFWLALATPQPP
jgi:hypothetical protein